ncbi:NAD(P)H-hydrate dehydratase [Nocardiopsis sp. RSe5-2]|uniref:Bifunctional NAD(P)H-hydrate repair enzyme n=1 Tax=Nocardiopsis endophytica TaxID=3018445 RepID=A0ABT4UDH1_9ACTN|nr:NAD(P)H-hydrate dehydratase [Nocardiopsis endophytica]MDA2814958.1 NAD(P)H-hydrate dehydratase [Nocardiopsis endophytica]
MRRAHTVETVRAAEGALMARLPDGALMARAAATLAVVCARTLPRVYGARVVLLVGSGDNGGDALYAGADLARRGARVSALLAGSKTHEGGLAALRAAGGRAWRPDEEPERADREIGAADLVVDGLVGIGGRGGLRPPHARLAVSAREAGAPVVAVDLPSGVDADTGRVEGEAVRADTTVCFGTGKPGLFVDPGAGHAGRVVLADIGLGPDLPEPVLEAFDDGDVASLLPGPGRDDDKYRRGVLGVAAGSEAYPGAAVLCTGGALRTGTGMVRYLGAEPVASRVLDRWPEAVVGRADPGARVAAWVIGPGRGTDGPAAEELRGVFASGVPVLADADALTLVAREEADPSGREAPTLLTPHAGELARLLGADRADVEARRLEHVGRAAERFGCTVLLKGSTTLVATPGRPVAAATAGTPLLATAGSGDVLAGIAGSLLAAGLPAHEAAVCAAQVHGRAAVEARQGAAISATDLWDGIPRAVAGLGEDNDQRRRR